MFSAMLMLAPLFAGAHSGECSGDTSWTRWGGPTGDFHVDGPELVEAWPESGPRRLWEIELGEGYSSLLCRGDRLYTVFSDEEAEANGWHLWTTFLDITMKNGKTISARVDEARGSANLPLTEEEVADKFRDCANFIGWPRTKQEAIIEQVLSLEKVSDIRELTKLLLADS